MGVRTTVLLLGAAVPTGDKAGETSHPRGRAVRSPQMWV